MSYLSEALYTQQLQTAYDTDPTIITSTIVLDTPAHSQKLQEMIMNKYALWEIQGETIAEEKLLLKRCNDRHKDYFIEMLTWYETAINFLDGVKTTTSVTDDTVKDESGKSLGEYEERLITEDKHYDLPRMSASENRPSSLDRHEPVDGSNTNSNDWENSGTVTKTVETLIKGGKSVIDLKREYQALIKNLYEEFANKFEPCFIRLWS